MPTALPTFAVATLAMLLVPGPSVLYLVARSVQDGRGCGLIAMLGVEVGALVHAIASACGLGAILASTPWALAVIRFGGAGYLLFMGIRQLRAGRSTAAVIGAPPTRSTWRLLRDGMMVDLLNPKTMLFFLAFLPQFVDPAGGPASGQLIVLGACFVGLAVVTDGGYILLAATVHGRMRTSRRWEGKVTGGVYVALAGIAALS